MIVNPVVKMRPHPAAHLIRKYLPSAQEVYEKLKITSKEKTVDYQVSVAQLRVVSPFRLRNNIALTHSVHME